MPTKPHQLSTITKRRFPTKLPNGTVLAALREGRCPDCQGNRFVELATGCCLRVICDSCSMRFKLSGSQEAGIISAERLGREGDKR